ncbi:30S ribosomal protein S13 [Candidatus Roizmanbacteria bacterium RIFCSPHIGHO2_02_FULL_40_9]|uniref:Small ribosomal subunit protein uS13 n=2 Tax=Candidatus Roizmaniibacteriota TaxID=1752723 RepID=A0A1F7IKZ1_9BACT|nr:MAG: 30S ribosomal protein S13 [Candidatus Roizmanbacteria bacterium RIFCSPHIGHO2_02_FULL_40_9]OGK44029.1 MAG: 30S ribosomal protein S13 [Candidatus Roizmanbacteria bacterium RIFCSPLOWO2_01_FULL_38_11]
MARIVGVNIPDDKKIDYGLTFIFGIGWSRSAKILSQAGVDRASVVGKLSETDLRKIQEIIEKSFKVEGDLKEDININIKRLKEIGAYRGLRHIHSLPSRGQRTRSNARTKRGKRKTVGALKKEDMAKLQQAAAKS